MSLNALVYHSVPLVEQFPCYDIPCKLIGRYPSGCLLLDGPQFVGPTILSISFPRKVKLETGI